MVKWVKVLPSHFLKKNSHRFHQPQHPSSSSSLLPQVFKYMTNCFTQIASLLLQLEQCDYLLGGFVLLCVYQC